MKKNHIHKKYIYIYIKKFLSNFNLKLMNEQNIQLIFFYQVL